MSKNNFKMLFVFLHNVRIQQCKSRHHASKTTIKNFFRVLFLEKIESHWNVPASTRVKGLRTKRDAGKKK